jgi:hypothetical protein
MKLTSLRMRSYIVDFFVKMYGLEGKQNKTRFRGTPFFTLGPILHFRQIGFCQMQPNFGATIIHSLAEISFSPKASFVFFLSLIPHGELL